MTRPCILGAFGQFEEHVGYVVVPHDNCANTCEIRNVRESYKRKWLKGIIIPWHYLSVKSSQYDALLVQWSLYVWCLNINMQGKTHSKLFTDKKRTHQWQVECQFHHIINLDVILQRLIWIIRPKFTIAFSPFCIVETLKRHKTKV